VTGSPASTCLKGQRDEPGIALALYSHENVLAPVFFGGGDFLLHFFEGSYQLVTDSDDEIARTQPLRRSGTILWDLVDNNAFCRFG